MAATTAALNGVLVAAVCVVLLHSSMWQQLTPVPHCHNNTGQQPAPAPAPAPTPGPAPAPSPAPAPVVDCPSYCTSQCNTNCTAYRDAGLRKCDANTVAAFNGCYESCTTHTCPGESCVHSGCGYGNCTCENANARSCCEGCSKAISDAYNKCRSSYERSVYYCMLSCTNDCKNCV